jgi:histidine kinase
LVIEVAIGKEPERPAFFRADPSRQGTGAGLGLALAKRIVEQLGGEISAESEPAHGARFAVTLPIR